MKKKFMIYISLPIIAVSILIGICLWNQNQNSITVFKKEVFCFEGIVFGTSETDFIKKVGTKLTEKQQGVHGEEKIYSRSFIWSAIDYPTTAYYYFDEQGFQRGIYRITFEEEDIDEIFSNITDKLLPVLEEANTYTKWTLDPFERKFRYTMEQIKLLEGRIEPIGVSPGYTEFKMLDDQGGILRINYFKEDLNGEMMRVIELEVFQNSYWKWPHEADVCWDAEKDFTPQTPNPKRKDLSYQCVRLLRFAASNIWITNEEGECQKYTLSPECSIYAVLDPSQYGDISYKDLVAAESSEYIRSHWFIGLNENGEIEHLIEGHQP